MNETTVQFIWFIVITLAATLLQIALFLGVVALVVLIVKKLWRSETKGQSPCLTLSQATSHQAGGAETRVRLGPAFLWPSWVY